MEKYKIVNSATNTQKFAFGHRAGEVIAYEFCGWIFDGDLDCT